MLKDFSNDPTQQSVYVAPIGLGEKPYILGKQLYVMHTYYPTTVRAGAGRRCDATPILRGKTRRQGFPPLVHAVHRHNCHARHANYPSEGSILATLGRFSAIQRPIFQCLLSGLELDA
jgi:hypothetical protein